MALPVCHLRYYKVVHFCDLNGNQARKFICINTSKICKGIPLVSEFMFCSSHYTVFVLSSVSFFEYFKSKHL